MSNGKMSKGIAFSLENLHVHVCGMGMGDMGGCRDTRVIKY